MTPTIHRKAQACTETSTTQSSTNRNSLGSTREPGGWASVAKTSTTFSNKYRSHYCNSTLTRLDPTVPRSEQPSRQWLIASYARSDDRELGMPIASAVAKACHLTSQTWLLTRTCSRSVAPVIWESQSSDLAPCSADLQMPCRGSNDQRDRQCNASQLAHCPQPCRQDSRMFCGLGPWWIGARSVMPRKLQKLAKTSQ